VQTNTLVSESDPILAAITRFGVICPHEWKLVCMQCSSIPADGNNVNFLTLLSLWMENNTE